MPIRLILFDMDDVLCHYDLGRRLRALSRLSGKTPRDIRAAIWDSGFEDAADSGGYDSGDSYLEGFARRLGAPITKVQWLAARRDAMLPCLDVLALARALGRTHATAIFTNNGPLVKQNFETLFPEAHGVFGPQIYCSYEFGAKKPDPDVYRRLLRRLGADPAETFFTDDKKSNVEGARLAGLHAHRFLAYEGLLGEVRRLGLPFN